MNPYAAPASFDRASTRGELPMVRYAAWCLYGIAGFNLLTALAVPVFYALIGLAEDDPTMAVVMGSVGLVVAAFIVVIAVLPLIAGAWGLRRGAKWAWFVTVIVGAMYAPSACLPIGAFLLYAMLNDEVRKAFLDN
jgi:MFS family permease